MKNVTWQSAYISKHGFALEHFLTEANFQPGKFIVLEGETPDKYRVVYVVREEEL